MKTKEEIEQLANDYGKSVGNTDGTTAFDFKLGYTQCQEDMADTMYDLLAWYMSDKGEQYRNETLFIDVIKDYFNSLNKQD
jgi:hypothetical protein